MISDTGTSWLALPNDQFNALVSETGADYDFWQDIYTVDCDAKGLPDLIFTIGGKKYSVSSKEYVLDVSDSLFFSHFSDVASDFVFRSRRKKQLNK